MYDFLVTATDTTGKRETHHVMAASAAEAHALLEAQGFQEITLHMDDAGAAAMPLTALDSPHVTPRDMVEIRYLSALGFFFFVLKKLYRRSLILYLAAAAFIVFKLVVSRHLGYFGGLAVVVLLMPPVIAAWATIFGAQRKFDLLLDASAWGRWNEVLSRAPALRGHVPDFELDAREACALAGLGRWEEGLEQLRQHEGADEPPHWMYLARLADFYDTAGMYDEDLRCHDEAYREAPDNPTVELDYALALLKNNDDAQLAERLIESAEARPLGDLLQLILPMIKGMLFLNTRRELPAIEAFRRADANLVPLAAGAPLIRQLIDINKAYLAIAQARSGDRAAAAQTAEPAIKRVRAINEKRLLAALETELGPLSARVP